MDKRVYLHRDDVWQNAPTGMTSASRDLFDYYYLAIRNTFLNQFVDPKTLSLAKKIHNVRTWKSNSFNILCEASETKTNKYILPLYIENELDLPQDETDEAYDTKIYENFEDFFNNADHGWISTSRGRDLAKQMWDFFIQDMSEDSLNNHLQMEEIEAKESVSKDEFLYSKFINDKENTKDWFIYLSNNIMNDEKLN